MIASPQAPDLVGALYAQLVVDGIVPLADIFKAVLGVPPIEEDSDPPLIDADHGLVFVYGIMSR